MNRLAVVAALAFAACLLLYVGRLSADETRPALEAAPSREKLKIFDAEYGDQASQRFCDATAVIAALCEGRDACSFPVGNALCGDPAFGTRKQLHMAFKCLGGAPLLILAEEPATVRLACPAPPTSPAGRAMGKRAEGFSSDSPLSRSIAG